MWIMGYKATITVSFIIWAECTIISDSRYCVWSNHTLDVVNSCPKTRSEVAKRATLKNCTSLAAIQNCSAPDIFKYHCVMNEFQNAFVEVCAPSFYIFGFCTEYNTYGAVIQPHYRLKCSNVDPPCAARYISTDAYLYTGCYDLVKNHIFEKSTKVLSQLYNLNNTSKSLEKNKRPNDSAYVIRIGVISVVSIAVVIFVGTCLFVRLYARTSSRGLSQKYEKCEPEATCP